MSQYTRISANFRTGEILPTIEQQYHDLWRLALELDALGVPIEDWCPPSNTPENSRLNSAFNANGPTTAALALAHAGKSNRAKDLRTLGVWNGEEDEGGITYTTTYNTGRIPANLLLSQENVPAFKSYQNVTRVVRAMVLIWNPMLVKVTPWGYDKHQIFKDRPPVGWMIYLPFEVTSMQVPEAAQLVHIENRQKKRDHGTLIISTTEVP